MHTLSDESDWLDGTCKYFEAVNKDARTNICQKIHVDWLDGTCKNFKAVNKDAHTNICQKIHVISLNYTAECLENGTHMHGVITAGSST